MNGWWRLAGRPPSRHCVIGYQANGWFLTTLLTPVTPVRHGEIERGKQDTQDER